MALRLANVDVDWDIEKKTLTFFMPHDSPLISRDSPSQRNLINENELKAGYSIQFQPIPPKSNILSNAERDELLTYNELSRKAELYDQGVRCKCPPSCGCGHHSNHNVLPRWQSATQGILNPDHPNSLALCLEGEETFIHTTDLSSKLLMKNDLYTSGTNADFSGDAVLSGGCGYCTNHELVLNGRSLTDIVAFLQDQNSACTEPFEVTLHIRAKPRKD